MVFGESREGLGAHVGCEDEKEKKLLKQARALSLAGADSDESDNEEEENNEQVAQKEEEDEGRGWMTSTGCPLTVLKHHSTLVLPAPASYQGPVVLSTSYQGPGVVLSRALYQGRRVTISSRSGTHCEPLVHSVTL